MLKLGRAKRHFFDFVAELRRFYEREPWTFSTALEDGGLVLRLESHEEIPTELSLIAGDLIHNARSALDCAIAEIASRGEGLLGRPATAEEERGFFFPVTETEVDFDKKTRKLRPFLSDNVLVALSVVQPWSEAQMVARRVEREDDSKLIEALILESSLRRLNKLSNLDKHRRLSLMLFRPDSVSEKFSNHLDWPKEDFLDKLADIEWLGMVKDAPQTVDLTGEMKMNLSSMRLTEPDYDFYFADEELVNGAEVGRYLRHDRSQRMSMRDVSATLRVVLFESGLTDVYAKAPPIERVLAELIDAVDSALDLLDYTGGEVPTDAEGGSGGRNP